MGLKLTNNAVGELATNINSLVTTITMVSGDGAKFPTLASGDWHPATLVKVDGTREICRVTARSGDTFTVARGMEGTTPLSFAAGDRFELRLTGGALLEFLATFATSADLTSAQNAIIALQNSKQDNLGFTPVQQGGGFSQTSQKVFIGLGTDNHMRVTALGTDGNAVDLGYLVTNKLDSAFSAPQTFNEQAIFEKGFISQGADTVVYTRFGEYVLRLVNPATGTGYFISVDDGNTLVIRRAPDNIVLAYSDYNGNWTFPGNITCKSFNTTG